MNLQPLIDLAASGLSDGTREAVTRYGLYWCARFGLLKVPITLWRGTTRSGRSGRLLAAGDEPWIGYLPQRFFEGEPVREPLGRVAVRSLERIVRQYHESVDLIIVRVDRLTYPNAFARGYLVVPEWIGTKLHVPDDVNAFVRSSSNRERDVRRVRTRKFQPFVSSDEQSLIRFYRSFYLPLSKARYGGLLVVRPIQDLKRRMQRGGILWACKDQEPLAGLLFEQRGGVIDVLAVGTLDGEPALTKQGAIAALYYFIVDLARRQTCHTVDFRGSRSSLTDGVLRYKCKWGANLYDKTDSFYDLHVHWPRVTPTIREFLTHTPLIVRDGEEFSGLIGAECPSEHELSANGLRRLYRVTDSGFQEVLS
jgi:hypothetical protein